MKNVHVIAHSHWDREWYMPFEYHRAYLVKLFDDCLELFEKDADFKSFHLDGHTALVEDYLEIKPENEELIKKYVKEGRFNVGPWYILQDEFLTSSEANIRNLLVGHELAEKLGKVTKIGYFPDSFGNAGQMPQILKQAGMKAIVFGRGVKSVGMNNDVAYASGNESYNSKFSELYWESPDGSGLPAILFANWYNNGNEIPRNADSKWWNNALEKVEKYASTDELLLMNGCDHQPVQKNLSAALAAAREKYPDYRFIHSNFEEYADAVIKALPEDIASISGELIGQDTDGWMTLVNTCSSHVDLKIMNRKCEILLESVAEPLSVIASHLGKSYPHNMLRYSWKTLMKNHPHDSICGCSCDEVNDEMRTRFIKSLQAAEAVIKEDLEYISKHIDKSGLEDCDAVFAVINTTGKPKTGVTTVDVDIRRIYTLNNQAAATKQIKNEMYTGNYELVKADGTVIPCRTENARVRFGYDLPDNAFRQPYMAETVTLTFEAIDVPPMGYAVFGVRKTDEKKAAESVTSENVMENKYIKVCINSDGTINVEDKSTGKRFENLLRLEDTGDIGTEYTYVPALDDTPIYSGSVPAKITLVKNEAFGAEYKIETQITIPKAEEAAGAEYRNNFVEIKDRAWKRGDEFVTIPVTFYVSLSAHSKRVDVRCEFENTARDHRLRVLFPTGLTATTHRAETVFEAPKRNNAHKACWTYPSGCEHQQGFVMMNDKDAGIAVANIGLYEYEILADNTIAVTILRAMGEIGDWGVFPTELSQQMKKMSCEFSIIPFEKEDTVYAETTAFQCPFTTVQIFDVADNSFKNGELSWTGENVRMTAFKAAERSNDVIMRWVNYSDKSQTLRIKKSEMIDNLYLSDVLERKYEQIAPCGDFYEVSLKPFEILTLGCAK